MLDRIEEGFQRLSNFSADIAHELRTPITNLKTQTEVALSQARSLEQYREILYSNLEEYERSEEHTSELQSLMRISYAVFCLIKKNSYLKQNRINYIHTTL